MLQTAKPAQTPAAESESAPLLPPLIAHLFRLYKQDADAEPINPSDAKELRPGMERYLPLPRIGGR